MCCGGHSWRLPPGEMTRSRGFVSAGRGAGGRMMWFAPPGSVPKEPPPPAGESRASWLARMALRGPPPPAPRGAVPNKADLPPPTGWPAGLVDAEMLVRSVERVEEFGDYGHRRVFWLARMASGGVQPGICFRPDGSETNSQVVEYVTRSGGAFVAGLRPGEVVRMSATVEGPDRSHPSDPSGTRGAGPGVLVLTRCRPPRGSRALGRGAA